MWPRTCFRIAVLLIPAILIVSGSGVSAADKQFPTRFLEVVVPFAPGGAVDNLYVYVMCIYMA